MHLSTPHPKLGRRLYSFAVISDTHLTAEDGATNSPYAVNRKANGRLQEVVEDINRRSLDFVINVGDLVHPLPSSPGYEKAVSRYKTIVGELYCPHYVVSGNHDVGDKHLTWSPAEFTSEAYVRKWEGLFGPSWYEFEYGGVVFMVINAQLLGSHTGMEEEQAQWLEERLATHAQDRVVLFSHYPPYLSDLGESEHYDNINQPQRRWLVKLCIEHDIEALFCGHVHNFWCDRFGATRMYLLPSTAFVRQDYSEMFHATPPLEGGREDPAKLGYFIVDVHEHGHVPYIVRYEDMPVAPARGADRPHPHPMTTHRRGQVLDLRHAWYEVTAIPPSGSLDEFERKPARNDYPILSLWEMGVQNLRVPIADLLSDVGRHRMAVAETFGFEFTIISVGAPSAAEVEAVQAFGRGVTTWEIALPEAVIDSELSSIRLYYERLDCRILISPIRSRHTDESGGGKKYYHRISHGFFATDVAWVRALAPSLKANGVSGVVFQLGRDEDIIEVLDACGRSGLDIEYALHMRARDDNPAVMDMPAEDIVQRAVEWTLAAHTGSCAYVVFDTFVDVDRGFCMRLGLVDRLYNPGAGARAVRALNRVLDGANDVEVLAPIFSSNLWVRPFVADAVHYLAVVAIGEAPPQTRCLPLPQGWATQCVVDTVQDGGRVSIAQRADTAVGELEIRGADAGSVLIVRLD